MFSISLKRLFFGILITVFFIGNVGAQAISFEPALNFETGGPKPNFVATDDINNDGHIDMLVSTEQQLHFLMGDGTGLLEERSKIRLDNSGTGAALGDFNGDGSLDIAISMTTQVNAEFIWYNYQPTQTTDIYLNDGASSPTFTKLRSLPYYGSGSRIQSDDFNDDGLDDLLIDGHVLLSRGDGSFNETDTIVTNYSYKVAISGVYTTDINSDGNIDIVYAGLPSSFCGNGDGTFFLCNDVSVPSNAMITDFNNDGLMDVIEAKVVSFKQIPYTATVGGGCGTVISYNYSRRGYRGSRGRGRRTRCFPSYQVTRYKSEPETSQIFIKLQNNDGSFNEKVSPVINGEIEQIEVVDLEGDLFPDVAVRMKNQQGVFVLHGIGNGDVSTLEAVENAPSVLSFEDLNEDGLSDIVYVGLSIPTKPDSDAWAFVHLQSSAATTNSAGTTTTTQSNNNTSTNNTPTSGSGSSTHSNFPAVDPNGETLEIASTITELYSDHFVIDGITIWFDDTTSFKYEPGFTLEVNQTAQVEANPNVDSSGTAIKVQVGPL